MAVEISFPKLSFAVIDDNAHTRRLVHTMLRSFGVRDIYEAEDGAAGLEIAKTCAPDILITDWAMPVIDGIELVKLIRTPQNFPDPFLPIIMLTAHAERARVLEACNAGVNEFLCKPVSPKALHQRIARIVTHPCKFIRNEEYFGPDRRENCGGIAFIDEDGGAESETFAVDGPMAPNSERKRPARVEMGGAAS